MNDMDLRQRRPPYFCLSRKFALRMLLKSDMESYNHRTGHSKVDRMEEDAGEGGGEMGRNCGLKRPSKISMCSKSGDRKSCAGSSHLMSREVRAVKQEKATASASQPSLPSWLLLKGEGDEREGG